MAFGAVNFLYYAKFMHFDALQHFIVYLIWTEISAILFFYTNVYGRFKK